MTNTTTFATAASITVSSKQVPAYVVAKNVVVAEDLGRYFGMASEVINAIAILDDATNKAGEVVSRIITISGVNSKMHTVIKGRELEGKDAAEAVAKFRLFQFLCLAALRNDKIQRGAAKGLSQMELMERTAKIIDMEDVAGEEESAPEAPVETEESTTETTVETEEKVEEPKETISTKVYQHGTVVKFGMGEKFFRIPSAGIHTVTIAISDVRGVVSADVATKNDVLAGFTSDEYVNGTASFTGDVVNAFVAFVNAKGQMPEGFVSPSMLVELVKKPVIKTAEKTVEDKKPANGETPAAGKKHVFEKENVQMKKSGKIETRELALNEIQGNWFSTLAQTGTSKVFMQEMLGLKAADKSPQTISLQMNLRTAQMYLVSGNEFHAIDMRSVFDPEGFDKLKTEERNGLDAGTLKWEYTRFERNEDGSVTEKSEFGYNPNIIVLGTENTDITKMKTESTDSAYITSNESEQARVASQGKIVKVNVENAEGQLVDVDFLDASNLVTLNFNGLGKETDLFINHLFFNGVYFPSRSASEELKMEELVKFIPSNDTPSQKRQAKVTFLSESEKFDVYDFMKALGNELKAYGKFVEINGKKYMKFDTLKNSTRLGLLGSASKNLKAFTEKFGKFESKEVLEDGSVIINTTTGLRVLLCQDITSNSANVQSKIFNPGVRNFKPGAKDALTSIMTALSFIFRINNSDGGIITNAGTFEYTNEAGEVVNMLKEEGLVDCVRNGDLRGWFHQFRMKFQLKGLNAVLEQVKELTGFDMILFEGARKTNLVAMLEDGEEMDYHVMLTASTFKEDKVSRISAQAMNNMNIDPEIAIPLATERFDATKKALFDVDAFMEAYKTVRQGKEYQELKHALAVPFGMDKFYTINPIVRNDIKAKLEIQDEITDMIRQHKNGYLFANAKNNYMFTDIYAMLKAVGNGTFECDEKDMAAKTGQVIVPMMDENGNRYFHEGKIASLRSPNINVMEIQIATAIDPVKYAESIGNEEMANFWKASLEGGFIDGVTFFSAQDIMVIASSGADFDGDTSLIIIDLRIVEALAETEQYVNFHIIEGGVYKFNEKDELVAGLVVKETREMVMGDNYQALLDSKVELEWSNRSDEVLGEGCPKNWTGDVATPAFNLPEGMFQKGYDLYIPAEMVDTDEAYKAWLDSIHQVVRYGISSSEIGRVSNIVMAIVNAINFVEAQVAMNKEKMAELLASEEYAAMSNVQQHNARAKFETSLLEVELVTLNQMLEVYTFIAWVAIDAAKHGGAYKKHLENWMKWTSKKEMERLADEVQWGTMEAAKSMKRVIGFEPSRMDAITGEVLATKVAIILPNALRQAKHKFQAANGSRLTNLQVYCNKMAELFEESKAERQAITVTDNNLLGEIYKVLADTSFNSAAAKELYGKVAEDFVKRDDFYDTQMKKLKKAARKYFVENRVVDSDSMNNAKQNARVKDMFPEYGTYAKERKVLLARTRQILHAALIRMDIDVVKFAAAAYAYAYETAKKLEKQNNQKVQGHVHALWKLLEPQLIHMFAAMEGARVKGISRKRIFELKNLYLNRPAKGLAVVASQMKEKNMRFDLAFTEAEEKTADGKNIFNVYLVRRGKDVEEKNLIGQSAGDAARLLISGVAYRVKGARILNVYETTGNVSIDLQDAEVNIETNMFEGLTPKKARQFFAEMKEATRFDVTLYQGASLEDLKEGKFVCMNVQGTVFFAKKSETGFKTVAVSTTPYNLEEGKNYSIKVEFSSAEGTLKAYVFEAVQI